MKFPRTLVVLVTAAVTRRSSAVIDLNASSPGHTQQLQSTRRRQDSGGQESSHRVGTRPQHQATAALGQRYSDEANRPEHMQSSDRVCRWNSSTAARLRQAAALWLQGFSRVGATADGGDRLSRGSESTSASVLRGTATGGTEGRVAARAGSCLG